MFILHETSRQVAIRLREALRVPRDKSYKEDITVIEVEVNGKVVPFSFVGSPTSAYIKKTVEQTKLLTVEKSTSRGRKTK